MIIPNVQSKTLVTPCHQASLSAARRRIIVSSGACISSHSKKCLNAANANQDQTKGPRTFTNHESVTAMSRRGHETSESPWDLPWAPLKTESAPPPGSALGVALLTKSPLPSCPCLFSPKAKTFPERQRARPQLLGAPGIVQREEFWVKILTLWRPEGPCESDWTSLPFSGKNENLCRNV